MGFIQQNVSFYRVICGMVCITLCVIYCITILYHGVIIICHVNIMTSYVFEYLSGVIYPVF